MADSGEPRSDELRSNEPQQDQMIPVSRRELRGMVKDSIVLQSLYDEGVDNWEGYEHVDEVSEVEVQKILDRYAALAEKEVEKQAENKTEKPGNEGE